MMSPKILVAASSPPPSLRECYLGCRLTIFQSKLEDIATLLDKAAVAVCAIKMK